LPSGKYKLNTYTEQVAVFQNNYRNYCSSLGMLAKINNVDENDSMID